MSFTLISVIVPVYNIREYVKICVRSITDQSYGNLEILLVDDGSTDGSGALCDGLASGDPRIRVIHKANEGVSVARNVGLTEAKGKFIAFIDGDDVISPDYFARLLEGMHEQTTLSMCGHLRFSEHPCSFLEKRSAHLKIPARECAKRLLMGRFPVSVCGGLFIAEEARKLQFPSGVKNNEDKIFLYQYLLNNEKSEVVFSNDALYGYYVRPGSATTSAWRGDTGMVRVAQEMLEFTTRHHPEWEMLARCNLQAVQFNELKSIIRSGENSKKAQETARTLRKEILAVGVAPQASFRMKVEYTCLRLGYWCYRYLVSLYYVVTPLEARQRHNERVTRQNAIY